MTRVSIVRAVTWLVALSGVATTLVAQADPLVPRCPEGAAPVVDSSVVVVGLAPRLEFRGRRYDAAHRAQNLYIADAIRAHFVPPASLGALPLVGEAPAVRARAGEVSRSALRTELVVIRRPNGHLREIAWTLQPASGPLGEALVAAVRSAEADGSLAEVHRPAGAKGDDTVALAVVTTSDSAPPQLPLMRARVPVYVVDSAPMVVQLTQPIYPVAARRARVATELTAWFLIGSDAQVIPASVQFTRVDWQDFIEPIRTALATSRFLAAQSGGCRVPFFAQQQFAFELIRR